MSLSQARVSDIYPESLEYRSAIGPRVVTIGNIRTSDFFISTSIRQGEGQVQLTGLNIRAFQNGFYYLFDVYVFGIHSTLLSVQRRHILLFIIVLDQFNAVDST